MKSNNPYSHELPPVRWLIATLAIVAAPYAHAISMDAIFQNLDQSLNQVYPTLIALCYILGVLFALRAMFMLKKLGYKTAFMHVGSGILGPVALLIVSVALMYAPQLIDILMYTIWGYGSVQNTATWISMNGNSEWVSVITPMIGLIQVVGIIAFMRGWILLAKSVGENSPPGNAGKGIVHVIAGILGINITGTIDLVQSTLGI